MQTSLFVILSITKRHPRIEMEFELVKQLLPNIPVMAVNQVAATILTQRIR